MTRRRPAALWAEAPPETWYNSHIWKKRARRQLALQPLCEVCLAETPERVIPATIADHCPPWRTWAEFCNGALRSVCFAHNLTPQFKLRGYSLDVDPETGLPADRAHPFWRSGAKDL